MDALSIASKPTTLNHVTMIHYGKFEDPLLPLLATFGASTVLVFSPFAFCQKSVKGASTLSSLLLFGSIVASTDHRRMNVLLSLFLATELGAGIDWRTTLNHLNPPIKV